MRTQRLSINDPGGLGVFPLLAKALTLPAAQADAFERRDAAPRGAGPKAAARRRGWLERLDHWFWTRQQRDLEAYLAQSTDVYDLEARIRALERKARYPYY